MSSGRDCQLLAPVLEAVHRSTFASLALVIEQRASLAGRIRPGMLHRCYRHWDERSHARKLEYQQAVAMELLGRLPAVEVGTTREPPLVELEQIRAHSIDVILSCSTALAPLLADCARYGVWSMGLARRDGGALQAYAIPRQPKGDPVSRISLIAQVGAISPARMLGRSVARQSPTLSMVNALEAHGRAAAELIIWKLRHLYYRGWDGLSEDPWPALETPTCGSTVEDPTTSLWRDSFGSWVAHRIAHLIKRTGTREWQIGIRRATATLPWEGPWDDFRWIEAPPGHYLADPFLFEHDGLTWLFAEDYDYAAEKGCLVCASLDGEGATGPWLPVLDLPVHLSFPSVFHHSGDVYLIPESQASGTVDLYRSTDFPRRWARVQTLWEGPGLDTVPYYHSVDGCWYFFTSVQSDSALPPQLLLFTAPDLGAAWRLHPASPLSLDIRYARNGGRIIERVDGSGQRKLYRISQDGSGKYGSSMHFHEIEVLTTERYVERLVATRLPPTGRDGSHQYDSTREWEVVDATTYTNAPEHR